MTYLHFRFAAFLQITMRFCWSFLAPDESVSCKAQLTKFCGKQRYDDEEKNGTLASFDERHFLSHEEYRRMYVCLENETEGEFWQPFNLGIRCLPMLVALGLSLKASLKEGVKSRISLKLLSWSFRKWLYDKRKFCSEELHFLIIVLVKRNVKTLGKRRRLKNI